MIEDSYTCEICMETYDLKKDNKRPKKVPCCGHTFCLGCLNEIYSRNNNIFLCPYCRKTNTTRPKHYITDTKVSSRFLKCCNCHELVAQNQLYLHFDDNDNMKLNCVKCHEDQDLPLYELLPDTINDYNTFLNQNRVTEENDLLINLKNNVKDKLTSYFKDIVDNMTNLMVSKILIDYKINYKIDLENKYKKFKEDITLFYNNYNYLKSFINDDQTKNFDTPHLLHSINFFGRNIQGIKEDIDIFNNFRNAINGSQELFFFKNNHLCVKSLSTVFIDVFDTVFNQKKKKDLYEDNNKKKEREDDIEVVNKKMEEDESFSIFKKESKEKKDRRISFSELDKLIIKNNNTMKNNLNVCNYSKNDTSQNNINDLIIHSNSTQINQNNNTDKNTIINKLDLMKIDNNEVIKKGNQDRNKI